MLIIIIIIILISVYYLFRQWQIQKRFLERGRWKLGYKIKVLSKKTKVPTFVLTHLLGGSGLVLLSFIYSSSILASYIFSQGRGESGSATESLEIDLVTH